MQARFFAPMSVIVLAFAAFAGPVQAQQADRFALEKSDDGYIRMDRRTGVMSICTERDGQLVCRLAADDRDAFQSDIERLGGAVEALSKRVEALEAKPEASDALPSQSEFDQGLNYMEQFFRRFMGVVEDFDRSWRDEPAKPDPERT